MRYPSNIIPLIPIRSWNAVSNGPAIFPGSTVKYLNIKGDTDPKKDAVKPAIYYEVKITAPSLNASCISFVCS